MSIRRLIQTGVMSAVVVLTTSTAAFADNGWEGAHRCHRSLLDLLILIKLGLLHGGGGLLG
jgi:hypothetical protein